MLKLENTSACSMRDKLRKEWFDKKITASQITDRLSKIEIPYWLQCEIIQMVNYRKYDRTTCAIELAMEAAICIKIVQEITEN